MPRYQPQLSLRCNVQHPLSGLCGRWRARDDAPQPRITAPSGGILAPLVFQNPEEESIMKRISFALVMSATVGLVPNALAQDCSNRTLQGTYAFRSEASPTSGGRRLNLALIEFHGDGTYTNLGFTANTDGVVATGTLTALYNINADCSGVLLNPDGSVQGPVIAHEDGSEFYFLRTNPSTLMLVGTGTKVTRGHGDKDRTASTGSSRM